MSKFLAGCHYNEEEISRHLKKSIGYRPVQIDGNKFATGQMLKKTGRSCEGVALFGSDTILSSQESFPMIGTFIAIPKVIHPHDPLCMCAFAPLFSHGKKVIMNPL
jgi:hypothetical protein